METDRRQADDRRTDDDIQQWRIQGEGLVGVQTPHDRTDENFQHRIKKMIYSVLCVIYAVSLVQLLIVAMQRKREIFCL